ncbi:MAG: tetratricopeptide repeat protein, partial [Myxococcales bacterium]
MRPFFLPIARLSGRGLLLGVLTSLALTGCPKKPDEKPTHDEVTGAAVGPATPEPPPAEKPAEPVSKLGEDEAPAPVEPAKEEVRTLDPDIREAFEEGLQSAINGDPQKAIERFKSAATDDPRTHWAHYNLGVLYERNGDAASAAKHYLRALDLKPTADRAADNYARLQVR